MRRAVLPLVCAMALGAAVPVASAAETRAEYVAQADAICKSFWPEAKAAAKRAKKNAPAKSIKSTDPKREVRKFARAFGKLLTSLANTSLRMTNQVGTLVPAPGDEVAVATWLAGSRQAAAHLAASGRAGRKGKFLVMIVRMFDAGLAQEDADAYVKGFGFRYCVASNKQPIAAAASYAQGSGE